MDPRPPHASAGTAAPGLVTLHVWGVPGRAVPLALARMGIDRVLLRRPGGPRFAKLLGTSHGGAFTPRDADPRHWALLATWDDAEHATRFEASATARGWGRLADERLRVALRPLRSRGTWSGLTPFGGREMPAPDRSDAAGATDADDAADAPIASITRARLAAGRTRRFWKAVPPVATDARATPGLRLAIGIGEAPAVLMGTFSLWSSAEALTAFAHRGAAHREVMARTPTEHWYAEELFARFSVVSVEGTHAGRAP